MLIVALIISVLIAAWFGLRAGAQTPMTPSEFATGGGVAIAWSAACIFLFHATWIAAALPAPWYDTAQSALRLTFWTGAFWLPCLGIVYVLRAIRARQS